MMQKSMRASAAMLATGLVLVACGTTSDTNSGAAPTTQPANAPASDPDLEPTETPTASTEMAADTEPNTSDIAADDAPTDTSVAAEAPIESDPAAAAEEPVVEAPPQSKAPAPPEAVLGGRSFASELASESDFSANMLPDLQVDDIRSGQKVNLRNVFPAERPVLFWMWAPH
jgi:hypothetical protein